MADPDQHDLVPAASLASLPWYLRILVRIAPKLAIRLIARQAGRFQGASYDRLHDAFARTATIDIVPSASGQRGFTLILDQSTAFYFYQEGDHFSYDGYELGPYAPGDVTVFDRRRQSEHPKPY